ncbi:Vaculolar membrane protein-domain-containing protein, partial [Neohortaea acidophila]
PVKCSRPTIAGDSISVDYRGTLLTTGAIFDESYKRGQPITFTLGVGQVISGWDEGLMNMCPGEERKLTIPPDMAYGHWGHPPAIPMDATLVFETKLVDIVGVKQEEITFAPSSTSTVETATTTEPTFGIATAPSKPPPSSDVDDAKDDIALEPTTEAGECRLLGPFALLVQGALGSVALLALVFKRWRETPKRPWKIFFFDASKQVLGSCLTHVLNLMMSMLGSVDMMNTAQKAAIATFAAKAAEGDTGGGSAPPDIPNPCSFYLLNLAIDTTLGIPVLYLLLRVLHKAFSYTPLARPQESIKSGHYGTPPHTSWWFKQSIIYFIGLTGMKLFVFLLFQMLPWLPWVGDWALAWTEGREWLQIAFAMFIFPLAMNMVQYWIIDSFIMEKRTGEKDAGGVYERVQGEYDDDGED